MNTTMVAVMLATSIVIGLIGLIAFLWGLKSGQFDDGGCAEKRDPGGGARGSGNGGKPV